MKISIGLPTAVPGVSAKLFPEWAIRAEAAGFARLGTISRIAFDSHDELIALAAAAAVTSRIGLATTVLVAPPRETVILAKQAATLDQLSDGRFVLGVGVGWRDDDFLATGKRFGDRGALLDRQIEQMRSIWRGEPVNAGVAPIGPSPVTPGGPQIWLGGMAPPALRRAGRLADAFIAPPAPLEMARAMVEQVQSAAAESGRGRLPVIGSGYFALGPEVEAGRRAMRAYYSFGGEEMADRMTRGMLSDRDSIAAHLEQTRQLGADEIFLWAASGDPAQVDALAKLTL